MKVLLVLLVIACSINQFQATHCQKWLGCPGGPRPVDPKEIWSQVESIVKRISNGRWTLIGIPEASVQVVGGYLYSVFVWARRHEDGLERRCFIKYLDRPWDAPEPDILKECCYGFDQINPCQEQPDVVGNPRPVNPNNLQLWHQADLLVKNLTHAECSLVQILGGTKQTVSGWIYDLDLLITRWDGCEPGRVCNIRYWDRPWISKHPEILSETCSWGCRTPRVALRRTPRQVVQPAVCHTCSHSVCRKAHQMTPRVVCRRISRRVEHPGSLCHPCSHWTSRKTHLIEPDILSDITFPLDLENLLETRRCGFRRVEHPDALCHTCSRCARRKTSQVGHWKVILDPHKLHDTVAELIQRISSGRLHLTKILRAYEKTTVSFETIYAVYFCATDGLVSNQCMIKFLFERRQPKVLGSRCS